MGHISSGVEGTPCHSQGSVSSLGEAIASFQWPGDLTSVPTLAVDKPLEGQGKKLVADPDIVEARRYRVQRMPTGMSTDRHMSAQYQVST